MDYYIYWNFFFFFLGGGGEVRLSNYYLPRWSKGLRTNTTKYTTKATNTKREIKAWVKKKQKRKT